ncbi:ABC transporter substrate binding protein [Butyrivibrio sp. VCB2006]|uniref:ABC transporter substrate binding protein n=1 Tax=Butyrivibrio sp. VCB2006 TaxID=1280679 RepID=UPI0009DB7229|nr:ABC transporter substrate binding protein [Butyrivibrio sp. VCB2006]
MKRTLCRLLITAYCAILMVLAPAIKTCAEDSLERQFHILFISSYGFSNASVPDTFRGFQDGVEGLNIEINYDFMEAQQFYGATDIANFDKYLRYKIFSVRNFDLIAVADDPALRYAINNRSKLFPDIPLVFMGINNITEATTAAAMKNATGIAENQDFENNYELMRDLFPNRNSLVVITDSTVTGQGDYVEFMKFKDRHDDITCKIINTSYYTQNGLKRALNALGSNDIILFLDFGLDGNKNNYSLPNAADFITKNTNNIPIFRLSSSDVGHGVLGGISYSFYDSGYIAGTMAKDILMGADPDDMPLKTATVTTTYFDQDAMDKFGIKAYQLPLGSVIVNEHETIAKFYRENKTISNLAIIIAILLIAIITHLYYSNRRRLQMARTDFLTQMPNRLKINEEISQIVANGTPYGMVMIDVDHFKDVNDTYGHKVGDEVIKAVAKRLKELADKDVSFARLGGDEFCAIFYEPSEEKERIICENIMDIMGDKLKTSAGELQITVSIGCAVYPQDVGDPDKLMECADKALYVTKENGRNGYTLFSGIDKAG